MDLLLASNGLIACSETLSSSSPSEHSPERREEERGETNDRITPPPPRLAPWEVPSSSSSSFHKREEPHPPNLVRSVTPGKQGEGDAENACHYSSFSLSPSRGRPLCSSLLPPIRLFVGNLDLSVPHIHYVRTEGNEGRGSEGPSFVAPGSLSEKVYGKVLRGVICLPRMGERVSFCPLFLFLFGEDGG